MAPARFGYGLGIERFERFRFSVPAVPPRRGFRRVPPCAVKPCAVCPVFAWVVGELRAADPSKCPRVRKNKTLAQGINLRLQDQGGSRGRSRTRDQKTRTVSTCWSNAGGISLRVFVCFSTVSQRGRFRFRFRFLENGSGGSGSAFGSCENGSDGSGFRFRFGSWASLKNPLP